MRSNVEDFVLAINIIERYNYDFDISEEINRICFDVRGECLKS
jgi:hypothetical protein